jgi:serine-type D-Ala-D-Ala carboxypeptidase (penicillin-binding protein 5/6)
MALESPRMKLRLLALLAALATAAPAAAAEGVVSTPEIEARAWFVQNATTGEVLLAQKADERVPIASITKLMTVIVALTRLDLDDVVAVHPQAARTEGATMNLQPGERVRVEDLVEGALVESANDAARALAFAAEDSEQRFVARMNATAKLYGLRDTSFANPTGLDGSGHYSSARDVTLLARRAMHNPTIRRIVRLRTVDAAGRRLDTWNDLLGRFPGLLGVKTGHTTAAGWSQVAAARSPGLTIYATILGSPTRKERNSDLAELLAWGLAQYRLVEAVSTERTYARAALPYGKAPLRLVADKPLLKVVRVHRPLVERVVAPATLDLPVRKGERVGEVRVFAAGKLLGTRPLVAAESVEKPGLASRVGWYARETASNIWDIVT